MPELQQGDENSEEQEAATAAAYRALAEIIYAAYKSSNRATAVSEAETTGTLDAGTPQSDCTAGQPNPS